MICLVVINRSNTCCLGALFRVYPSDNPHTKAVGRNSKYIHDIEYTEEIMQSINSLSVNIEESMKRINGTIDKLLDRHLSCELDYLEGIAL